MLGGVAALVSLTAVLLAQSPLPWVAADPEGFDPAVGQALGPIASAVVGLVMAGLAVGLLRWRGRAAADPAAGVAADEPARVEV